jgi:thiamine biosynthesis lipoprotein
MLKKTIGMVLMVVILAGCAKTPVSSEALISTTYALGTVITINLFDEGTEAIMTKLNDRILEIESLMSSQMADSEVNQINNMAGKEWVKVSDDTFKVVERALYYGEVSMGSFDPTIGPIIELWGIGTDEARVPSQSEIDERLKLVDYLKVEINQEEHSVFLPIEGMSIDLGGIAKGFVADELVLILKAEGIKKAMINLGGNVYAYGTKDGDQPWKVAIQTPYDQRNTYFGYIELKDKTVVTSGPYERYFEQDGKIYHHIFDANTGYPVDGETVSVSIISESSMDADALSTLLFTISEADGLALIESIKDVECIYVDKAYQLRLSSGLEKIFTLTDSHYKLLD